MAIIQMGGIVSKISGKIGGQTFANNRAGSFLKNTGTYKKALTLQRSQALAKFTPNNQLWRSLTEPQRTSWNFGAQNFPYLNRLGETKYYSGYQLCTMFNGNLAQFSPTPITVCPAPYSVSGSFNVSIAYIASELRWIGDLGLDPNLMYNLYMSPCISVGHTLPSMSFRYVRNGDSTFWANTFDITVYFEDKYGLVVSGTKIFWYLDGIHNTRGIRYKKLASGFVNV